MSEVKFSKVEQVLAELQQNVEQAQQARKELGFAGDPRMREALRAALGQKETSIRVQAMHELSSQMRSVREKLRIKAHTISHAQGAGRTATVYRMLARGGQTHLLQDYITVQQLSGGFLEMQSVVPTNTQNATTVPEGNAKPERTSEHVLNRVAVQKVAIAEIYTEEGLRMLGQETLVSYLELQLSILVEEAISAGVAGTLAGTAVPFNAALYSASVPNANFIDALVLAIAQERETTLYLGPRSISDVGLVVLPRRYWQRLGVLKDAFGRRLYKDWNDALMEELDVATHTLVVGAVTDTAFIVRPAEYIVGYLDDIIIYNQRLPDSGADKNLYRITAEAFISIVWTPRTSASDGFARSVHLVNDVATIKQP